jgi:hypothetical protein
VEPFSKQGDAMTILCNTVGAIPKRVSEEAFAMEPVFIIADCGDRLMLMTKDSRIGMVRKQLVALDPMVRHRSVLNFCK